MKFYKINDDIYHRNFHLVVNVSDKDFADDLIEYHKLSPEKAKEQREWLANAKGAFIHEWQPFYYLWIKDFHWYAGEQAVLVHEVRHLVDWVLHNSGIDISWENTEVGAFYSE